MTTPNLPWDSTTQDDLSEGVVMPANLGSSMQDHTPEKYSALAAGRFPGVVSGTSAGSPADVDGPLGFVVDLASNLMSDVATADPATIKKPADLYDKVGGFTMGLPLQGIFKGLIEAIQGVFTGGGPLGFLSSLMGQRWQQVDDLQDVAQEFEGIQVYGARFMPSSMEPTSSKKRAPFTGNIHQGVGVTYVGSEIVLGSRGLFKADAQCFFSWVVAAGSGCYMDIVVRTPSGAEFSRKPAISRSTGEITVFNSHTFGVPSAGYRLSVEVAADSSVVGATREILGGRGYTSLVVNKWSSEPE